MKRTSVAIVNKTRGKLPSIPFTTLKKAVLGNTYDLSVALLSPSEARRISKKTKHKDVPSNVLSFPLSKHSGEILLCPATARTQAPLYGATANDFLSYLFIHGMLHLKGFVHGATMEASERRLLKRFGVVVRL